MNARITREEFVDQWFRASGLTGGKLAELGIEWRAVTCDCGEDWCQGWVMLTRPKFPLRFLTVNLRGGEA